MPNPILPVVKNLIAWSAWAFPAIFKNDIFSFSACISSTNFSIFSFAFNLDSSKLSPWLSKFSFILLNSLVTSSIFLSTNFSLSLILSSVFNSVSAKNFLYSGRSFSNIDLTFPPINIISSFNVKRFSSFIPFTLSVIDAISLLISLVILSLNVLNLSSILSSESEINFLYLGLSTFINLSTFSDKDENSPCTSITVLEFANFTLFWISPRDSSTYNKWAAKLSSRFCFSANPLIVSFISSMPFDKFSTLSKPCLNLLNVLENSDNLFELFLKTPRLSTILSSLSCFSIIFSNVSFLGGTISSLLTLEELSLFLSKKS